MNGVFMVFWILHIEASSKHLISHHCCLLVAVEGGEKSIWHSNSDDAHTQLRAVKSFSPLILFQSIESLPFRSIALSLALHPSPSPNGHTDHIIFFSHSFSPQFVCRYVLNILLTFILHKLCCVMGWVGGMRGWGLNNFYPKIEYFYNQSNKRFFLFLKNIFEWRHWK